MDIGVIGVGSIGGTIAAGYRELGHTVYENDIDVRRTKRHIDKSAMGQQCDIVFITVPTPTDASGCDTSAVEQAITGLGEPTATVVIRSTVAPGTTNRLADIYDLPLVHMPEMLRDRGDVDEFLNPDRLVIAGPEPERQWIVALHNDFDTTIFEFDDPAVAELAKYAHNALWATKVSFANQVRLFAEHLGVDPTPVMEVVAADRRNTGSHLDPTLGPYAGRCVPKDLGVLLHLAESEGIDAPLFDAVDAVNELTKSDFDAEPATEGMATSGLSAALTDE